MKINEIPGKMISTWEADVKAVLDTWSDYYISLDEFKDAVLNKGLNFAKTNGCTAWIVDSSTASGVFPSEIQNFIGTDVFPTFFKNGVKFFITIKPEVIGLTTLNVSAYSAKAGPAGIKLVDVSSVEDAKMWLREHKND